MVSIQALPMPAKKPKLNVYVSPEVLELLHRRAASERRTLSQMAAILIEEGLTKGQEDR